MTRASLAPALSSTALSGFCAAIFDLDGTIAQSSDLHLRTFNDVLKELGITIRKDAWYSLYEGTGARHIFEEVLAKHGLLGTTDVDSLLERRRSLFRELAMLQLIPVKGFLAFFEQLKALDVPCIIATNSEDESAVLSLRILKLDEVPRVTAADAGKLKPDPAIYTLACKRLKLPPTECVVFEDSVAGVTAAKRAGCYTIALLTTTPRARLEEAGADLIVADFTKVSPGLFFEDSAR
jgi:beta-phosphoglucomutase